MPGMTFHPPLSSKEDKDCDSLFEGIEATVCSINDLDFGPITKIHHAVVPKAAPKEVPNKPPPPSIHCNNNNHTVITSTTAPLTHHSPNPAGGGSGREEFGFPFFPVFPPDTFFEEKKEEEDEALQHLIDCSKSSSHSSVSTMTKATAFATPPAGDPSTAGKSCMPGSGRKRPPGSGFRGAFSKLTLCGTSAKEDSLDLEYVVLSLRQALTAQEATESLKGMVRVLKKGRVNTKSGSLSTTEIQEGLVAAGADHCVVSTLWNFPSNKAVQYYGIVCMGELVAHSHVANQKSFVLKGGVEVVLTAMKTHAAEEPIQEESCRTLKNLMKYFDTAKLQVARHKGISRIIQAMMIHPEDAGVQRQACYALTSLSCLKPISDELVAKQGHACLLKTMQHHNDDCYVLAEAWRTLTNIVIHSMNSALDEEIAAHGMELVCQAMYNFSDCTLVPIQTRGLTLLTHLCYRSPTNLERLTQTHNLEMIHHVLKACPSDEKVQAAGEKLVSQISQAGYSLPQRSSRRPPQHAVIGQIESNGGTDVIVDASIQF